MPKFNVEIDFPGRPRDLEVMLRDALSNFVNARRNPEEYVAVGYPFWTGPSAERKVEEVRRRVADAENTRVLTATPVAEEVEL